MNYERLLDEIFTVLKTLRKYRVNMLCQRILYPNRPATMLKYIHSGASGMWWKPISKQHAPTAPRLLPFSSYIHIVHVRLRRCAGR